MRIENAFPDVSSPNLVSPPGFVFGFSGNKKLGQLKISSWGDISFVSAGAFEGLSSRSHFCFLLTLFLVLGDVRYFMMYNRTDGGRGWTEVHRIKNYIGDRGIGLFFPPSGILTVRALSL